MTFSGSPGAKPSQGQLRTSAGPAEWNHAGNIVALSLDGNHFGLDLTGIDRAIGFSGVVSTSNQNIAIFIYANDAMRTKTIAASYQDDVVGRKTIG